MATDTKKRKADATDPAAGVEKLLSRQDVADALGITTRYLDKMSGSGDLPRPDLFLGNRPRWRPVTINRWIAEQSAGG